MKRAEKTVFSPTDALNEVLVSCETSPVTTGVRLSELLRRPQVDFQVALGLLLADVIVQRFRAQADFLGVGGAHIGADEAAGVNGIFLVQFGTPLLLHARQAAQRNGDDLLHGERLNEVILLEDESDLLVADA